MKRNVTLFIIILLSHYSKAQSDSSVIGKSNFIIQHLDTSKIPYRVLYDIVSPIAQLNIHNGQNDSAISSPIHFQQAYFEYFQSNLNKAGIKTPRDVISQIKDDFNENTHPLGFLFSKYAIIKENAIHDSLLRITGGQLFDVAGSSTPYETKSSTVVSALTDGNSLDTGIHYFQLHKDFILGNNFNPIKKITFSSMQTRDEQERNVSGIALEQYQNIQPFKAYLDRTGVYTFTITIEYISGRIENLKFGLDVLQGFKKSPSLCDTCIVIQGCDGGDKIQITADTYSPLSDYGVTPTQATGTAYIFYATNGSNCADHKITKPVIFLDGYDPDNGRDAPRIYSRYINKTFNLPPSLTVKLADYLRSQGYDLIILDYNDGGDYIENNAMVVSKLLQTLWTNYQTTIQKDFVIIGPSMGALIGQFALAYMEHNSIPTHTRLYISFDGPHQGANVSIGMQEMIEYALQSNTLNGLTSGKLDALKHNLIENPAARQMLLHHYFANSQTPQPDNFRSIFLSHLASQNIYPQNLRKVAVINGNKSASLNPYLTTCNRFTKLEHHLHSPLLIIPNPIWWMPPVIIPPVDQDIDWRVYASSGTTSCKSGSFYTFWPLGNVVGGIPFGTTEKYSQGLPQGGGYDVCPGSNFGVDFTEAQSSLDKYLGWLPFSSFDLGNTNKFTFMPTTSSSDYIQSSPININADLTNVVLAKCAGTSPFDRVYANNYRTDHVSVDANIATSFLNEIEETVAPWDYVTTQVNASSTSVCDGQSITLSTPNIPSSANVQWSASLNNVTFSSQGNTTTNATKITGSQDDNENFYINATSNCGNFIGQTNVQAGLASSPSPYITITPTSNCYKWSVNVTFPNVPSASSYDWGVGVFPNCTSASCSMNGSNAGTFTHILDAGQKIQWSSSATNSCGTKYNDGQILELVVNNGSPCTAYLNYIGIPQKTNTTNHGISAPDDDIIIFPNPSSNFWTISLMKDYIKEITYFITDITGNTLKRGQYDKLNLSDIKIDNTSLPVGAYFLNIHSLDKNYNFKLIKE